MNSDKPPLNPTHSCIRCLGSNGNREPILSVLKEKLPKESGRVLEMASGSGMHMNFFAPHFKHLHLHPTDKDKEVFDNIKQLSIDHGNDNITNAVMFGSD